MMDDRKKSDVTEYLNEMDFCLNLAFETMNTVVSDVTLRSVVLRIAKALNREGEIDERLLAPPQYVIKAELSVR